MIKVSFIVIAYNIESYIKQCLTSIIGQTLEDIEIIVVNDGSDDNTLNNIESAAKYDNRLKVISQKNKGASEARKTGLNISSGKYIVFIDGDDWIESTLAEELYNLAEKKLVDIICFNYYIEYENKTKEKFVDNNYENIQSDKYLNLILEQKITHNLCNKFIRKSYINKTMFNTVCETSMGEDLAANVVLGIENPKVIMIDKAYYYYYQRSTSTMHKSSRKLLEIETTLNYIENILKQANLFEKYKEQVDFLWFMHCYLARIVYCEVKIDENHRMIYDIWKKKNLNIKNNKFSKEYMKKISIPKKIIKLAFDFNYSFGVFLLKIAHKILKIKY